MNRNLLIVCGWCAFLIVVMPALADETGVEIPPADQILDRYVEATGGREAYDEITNRVTEASLVFVGQNLELTMVMTAAKPNLTRIVVESDALGTIEKGSFGDLVWESSMVIGPAVKEGAERDYLLRESTFDKFAYWREVYSEFETVGLTTVDGQPCFEVVVASEIGGRTSLHFASESGLLLRVQTRVATAMGEIPILVDFSDYRCVDGVMLPFKATTESIGQTRVLVVESITHNVDLDEDFFEPSEEIMELVSSRSGLGAGDDASDQGKSDEKEQAENGADEQRGGSIGELDPMLP